MISHAFRQLAAGGRAGDALKRVVQVLAMLCMLGIWAIILHKGAVDIAALAQKHSGEEFWLALLQYFIRNLAGGS